MARKRNRKPHQKNKESNPNSKSPLPANQNDNMVISEMMNGIACELKLHTKPENKAKNEGKLNLLKGNVQLM